MHTLNNAIILFMELEFFFGSCGKPLMSGKRSVGRIFENILVTSKDTNFVCKDIQVYALIQVNF